MEKAKEIGTNFGDVPNSILVSIFERLPIATILKCRRVCKRWNSCLSSLDFFNSYQTNSPYPTLIHSNLFSNYHLLQFIDENNITTEVLRIPHQISTRLTRFVGSCNGLVCILKATKPLWQGVVDIFVGNPILGEYCVISGPKFKSKVNYEIKCLTYGFGFCLNSGHYKVVRMLAFKHGNQEYAEFQILTVGVDEDWRVLDCHISSIPKHVMEESGYLHRFGDFTYFAGAVYWLSANNGILDSIYSFEFLKEKVEILPPPLEFKDNNCDNKLIVYKDCLCLVVFDSFRIAMRSVKQHGLSYSRSKDVFSIDFMHNSFIPFYPIGRWRNDEEILAYIGIDKFISYNTITKNTSFINVDNIIWSSDCVRYSLSLIRLKDALQVSKNKEDDLPLKFLDKPSSSMGVRYAHMS